MFTLQQDISSLMVLSPSHFKNLTVFPLVRPKQQEKELDYLLLDEGISSGAVHITELHANGRVPELRLENNADKPVFLLNGEELLGAKQNRVLNLTILVPAKCALAIPVSCAEAGRWNMAATDMHPAAHVMYSDVRSDQTFQVTESLRSSGTPSSDQASVWRNIAAKAARLKSVSPTGAMSDIYRSHASSIEAYVRAFPSKEHESGAAFGIEGQIIGLDVFDHSKTMQRLFPKLVRSYALDALDRPTESSAPADQQDVVAMIEAIGQAQTSSDKAIGLGKDVRFTGRQVSGAALWAEGRYLHICGFTRMPTNRNSTATPTYLARGSRRNRF
jgi:hypothetical protein